MPPQVSNSMKMKAMLVVAIFGVFVTFLLPPIGQNPAYHMFADQREILGVPNFWNVVTNIPFILVGLIGLGFLALGKPGVIVRDLIAAYIFFFLGIALTGFGSGYYHLAPGSERLFWDRLPMTLAFMAFFCLVVGGNISTKLGKRLLLPLTSIGALSVLYWICSERAGQGDLRPYALVQFLPAVLIPMILWMFPARFIRHRYVWGMLGLYTLSKIAEEFDEFLFDLFGVVSGHSLKHLTAAAAALFFLVAVMRTQSVETRGK
jgi:hypothetical protein